MEQTTSTAITFARLAKSISSTLARPSGGTRPSLRFENKQRVSMKKQIA